MDISLEALNKIKEKAARMSQSQNPFKLVFVPDGTLYVRLLLDSDRDYVRTYHRHKWNNMNIHCLGPDRCKICDRLSRISDPRWDNEHQFRPREVAIAYAWIEDFENVTVNPSYIHARQHVLLMGKSALGAAISNFITEVSDLELIKKVFNPEEKESVLELVSHNQGSRITLTELSMKTLAIPPLPENFPPLSHVFFKDDDEPDPRYVNQFLSIMERSRRESINGNSW